MTPLEPLSPEVLERMEVRLDLARGSMAQFVAFVTPADLRSLITAAREAYGLREALKACRTNIAGYNLRDGSEALKLVDEFFNELQRIHKVAVAALMQGAGGEEGSARGASDGDGALPVPPDGQHSDGGREP